VGRHSVIGNTWLIFNICPNVKSQQSSLDQKHLQKGTCCGIHNQIKIFISSLLTLNLERDGSGNCFDAVRMGAERQEENVMQVAV
jgi:Uma2 family endonuclease